MIGLITGSVVVEQIFGVPGLGQMLLSGVQNNDYNVIMARCACIQLSLYCNHAGG